MTSAVLFDLFGTLVPSPPVREYKNVVDSVARIAGLPDCRLMNSLNDGCLSTIIG
jgi:FMN phosphatase YigB (HAD superfamily)